MVEAYAPGLWHVGQARRQDPALEWDRFLLEARDQLADVVGGDQEGGHACRHLLVQAQQLSQTPCKMPGEDLGHGTDVQDMSKGWMPCPVSAGLAPQQPEFRGGPHHFTRGSRDCRVGTSASSTVSSAAVNKPGCTRCKKVHYASRHPLNLRSGSASRQNPTARPTGPCLTGEGGTHSDPEPTGRRAWSRW